MCEKPYIKGNYILTKYGKRELICGVIIKRLTFYGKKIILADLGPLTKKFSKGT